MNKANLENIIDSNKQLNKNINNIIRESNKIKSAYSLKMLKNNLKDFISDSIQVKM